MTVMPLFFFFFSICNWLDFLAIGCKPRSGRPATEATRKTKDKADVLIWYGSWRELQLVNSERYVQKLISKSNEFKGFHQTGRRFACSSCLTKPPHTTLRSREVIAAVGWTVFSHPSYTADSALSDFQILVLWRMHFEDAVLRTTNSWNSVREELRRAKGFTPQTHSFSRKDEKKAKTLIMQETLCKNNLNSVKVLLIIYVNLTLSVIVVSLKKIMDINLIPTFLSAWLSPPKFLRIFWFHLLL
jgi:hypothetical protein